MLWKDKYNIGVDLIDRQHRELFERVNRFLTVLRSPVPWEEKVHEVNETLAFMQEYVVVHFRDEEQYQEELGYPGLEEHRKVHVQLIHDVTEFAKQYEKEGYREELVQQFGGRLLAWLINHVAATDQKIGEYARSKEAKHE